MSAAQKLYCLHKKPLAIEALCAKPPQGERGKELRLRKAFPFSRRSFAPELCGKPLQAAPPQRMIPKSGQRFSDRIMGKRTGSGAPTGASSHWPCLDAARQRSRRRPLASRRSTAALAGQLNATAQPRPRFTRSGTKALPPPFDRA